MNEPSTTTREPEAERFKFRHVHAITGTFVLLAVGVLIAVMVFAGRSQRWFIPNVSLRIILPEAGAGGIRQGSEVYFLGTLMGSVADVSVDEAGRMEALVNIRRDFFLFVRADSSAVIKRKFGVVGDAYFEITRGHGKPLPEKNAAIVCNEQLPSPLEAAVEEVRREAVPAIRQLSKGLEVWTLVGSNLITTRERLDQLILLAGDLATDLKEGKGTAGKLLTDPSMADELQSVLTDANHTLKNFQVTLQNLEEASGNLRSASTNLPAISDTVASEAKDLPGLILQTQEAMRELERLIQAAQKHWLVRKYIDDDDDEEEKPVKEPRKVLRSPRGRSQL